MNIDFTNPDDAYQLEGSTFKVRKTIRNRTNKDGKTKVIIEVQKHTYSGTGKYEDEFRRISTGIWINPKNWNRKKEEVNSNEPDSGFKNNEIQRKFAAIQSYVSSKGQQRPDQAYAEGLNLDCLVEFFPPRIENAKSLYEFINDYIKHRRDQKTVTNTLKEFTTMQNRLKAFDDYKGKKTRFEDISLVWSDDFEYFLRNIAKFKVKGKEKIGYDSGTIGKTYSLLVTVLNHFYNRRSRLKINLSDEFKTKSTVGAENGFKRGRKSINMANPLSEQQLKTLFHHNFQKPHLQLTKDRFVWQCYTGLRYSTAFTVTKEHFNNGWLHIKPAKTVRFEVKVEQPLNSVAMNLLKKYDYDMTKLAITNQAYNRDLKEMFKILKKDYPKLKYKTDYGSYCSRDTFISLAVKKGANWKDILRWVGQSSYQIMDRYIKPEDKHQEKMIKSIFRKPIKRPSK